MSNDRPIRMWHLLSGFTVWSLLFVCLYGVQGLGCELGWNEVRTAGISLLRLLLIILYVLGTGALAGLLLFQLRRSGKADLSSAGFLPASGLLMTLAALIATIATFSPVLFLTLCN